MSEVERIVDHIVRARDGDAWHGPALFEVLADVGPATAAAHRLEGAHSIWELVLHLRTWHLAAVRWVRGEIVTVPPEDNFPPPPEPTEAAWNDCVEELRDSFEQLIEAVSGLTDEALDECVPGREFSVYVLLHGVVQHDLYHAGQIALLKKP